MSYPKGVYKMMPKTLSFGKDGIFGKPEQRITVKMVLGEQTSCVYGVGNDIKFDDALFFSKLPEEKLLITIYSTDKDEKLGYAEVLLTPLVKIPQTRHEVTIHSIYRDSKTLAVEDKESAVFVLEILYTEHFRGFLQITVVEAELLRNTQVFGLMDPYAVLTLGEQKVRTKVLKQAGRKPKWNETFQLEVSSPSQELSVSVQDEDVTTNDIVGTAVVKLRAEEYFRLGNHVPKTVKIAHKGEDAGILNLSVRFYEK